MVEKTTLILFTGSYPYSKAAEDTFLNPEIGYLVSNFDEVIIVPEILDGDKQEISHNIKIEESYAKELEHKSIVKKISIIFLALTSILFYNEILSKPNILFHIRMLLRLVVFVGIAATTKRWITKYIQNKNLDLNKIVFYTYWLDSKTMGIGLVKENYPNLKLISRAHGWDLYEERHKPPYIPCRLETLKVLDKLFLISENGRNYIVKKYPIFASICRVSRLGVKEPIFISEYSKDNVFRIVSCSYIVPVKRIDLLLRGIVELGKMDIEQKFEWYHIGDGPLKPQIEDNAKQIMPSNINYHFLGHLPNDNVMSFYKGKPVDVFMNMSSSEGIAVSIMEVQSCGIPVIATAVGGTPEIVSEKVGKLLSQNPTANEIADAINIFLKNPEISYEKRKASKMNWKEKYDADRNFIEFVNELNNLVK